MALPFSLALHSFLAPCPFTSDMAAKCKRAFVPHAARLGTGMSMLPRVRHARNLCLPFLLEMYLSTAWLYWFFVFLGYGYGSRSALRTDAPPVRVHVWVCAATPVVRGSLAKAHAQTHVHTRGRFS